ncbi:tetratricopeptide repeat protein [Trichlorobacter sp.]|uniref:tetratricopeptide repeat protein n=1 Tax=Trichlorobacter sp. TaxID=2911007 RepID=UPI002A3712A1|nr:tetratricopeptide repeat protein [Trichlorobacter sp.]MDY0383149.1 tetratricopeptide repeat protein [Trichlorobacter sp.]
MSSSRSLITCFCTLARTGCRTWLIGSLLVLLVPVLCCASLPPNHLQRIELHSKQQFTRVTFKLSADPRFEIVPLAGNRLRLQLHDTTGRLFRGLRRYADRNIGGLVISQRGSDLVVTFALAPQGVGWRVVHLAGVPALSLDVGPLLQARPPQPMQPGRERIWGGAEKLLRDFDPPIKPEVPFVPTDRLVLKDLLNQDEQKLFQAAEGALYKGQLTSAEDLLLPFANRTGAAIRPLALYRLAETRYRLQRYSQSLENFREAEQLWPEFLSLNPASMFFYGDSIARNGNLPAGRQLLTRLVVSHADKPYAQVLLVRVADVLARQGNELGAQAIYRTAAESFADSKARQIALMKLADRDFLRATPLDYQSLTETYHAIAKQVGDFDLREEASFKAMLLAAINAPANSALDEAIAFQKRFPRGVYTAILREMREDLVEQAYRQGAWDKDPAALLGLVTTNQDYLATALGDDGFLPAVTSAFDKAGRPLDLIALYVGLLDRPWVGEPNAPYLYLQVAEHAELLGDTLLAKKMLRSFLTRFPANPQAKIGKEKLGALQYLDGEQAEARSSLLWLLNKGEQAEHPLSYYYLGRALWDGKNYAQAAQALERYVFIVQALGQKAPLVGDAYYIAAQARQSLGQYQQSLQLLESGMKSVPVERRDQFLFKLGEVHLQDGKQEQARSYFEQLSKEGKDADWRRLAAQSLYAIATSPSSPSKNQKVK